MVTLSERALPSHHLATRCVALFAAGVLLSFALADLALACQTGTQNGGTTEANSTVVVSGSAENSQTITQEVPGDGDSQQVNQTNDSSQEATSTVGVGVETNAVKRMLLRMRKDCTESGDGGLQC